MPHPGGSAVVYGAGSRRGEQDDTRQYKSAIVPLLQLLLNVSAANGDGTIDEVFKPEPAEDVRPAVSATVGRHYNPDVFCSDMSPE